ncbi:MAG: hypothetical protein AAFQ84_13265 [Pseudomonadota bacterium]
MVYRSIIIALAAASLSGCLSHGSREAASVQTTEQFEPGKTTIHDVYGALGQPHSVGKDANGNGTVWRYYHVKRRVAASSLLTNSIPVVNWIAPTEVNDIAMTAIFFRADDTLWEIHTQENRKRQNGRQIGLDTMTRSGEVEEIREEMGRLGMPFEKRKAQNLAWVEDVFVNP